MTSPGRLPASDVNLSLSGTGTITATSK
jgi:hypothetical protein